jgi:hypothetical protein
VVTGLTTLIAAINELVRAYIQHTNQLLSGGVNSLDTYAISNFLNTANTAVQTAAEGVGKGKGRHKKPRKEKDPNAPKRPLTAFFLYSGSARPIVKADNPDAPAADVNAEILRRWKAISDEDKAVSILSPPSRRVLPQLTTSSEMERGVRAQQRAVQGSRDRIQSRDGSRADGGCA